MNKLDCIGEPCPLPLLKVEKYMKKLRKGDSITVDIDHTCAMTNIPEWARKKGYQVETKEVSFGEWQITIQKTK
ncbi:MAG: sulfurtransferase TusA family protein [Halanaerobiales bacterium]